MIDPNATRVTFDEIDSTNAEAARRASVGDIGPYWLVAAKQTAGRGRRGRSWTSEPGNLFATYLGVSEKPPGDIALLSFAVALAVADVADNAVGRPVALVKWPNDVMVLGRKISGILLESGALGAGRTWVAIGIGINITSVPTDVEQPIAALSSFANGKVISVDSVEQLLRRRLGFWAGRLEREGFAPIRDAWLARAHGMGAAATARLGNEEVAGTIRGLGADGALELELPDGRTRLITAGEVFFGPQKAA